MTKNLVILRKIYSIILNNLQDEKIILTSCFNTFKFTVFDFTSDNFCSNSYVH